MERADGLGQRRELGADRGDGAAQERGRLPRGERSGIVYDCDQRPFDMMTPCGVPGGGLVLNRVS